MQAEEALSPPAVSSGPLPAKRTAAYVGFALLRASATVNLHRAAAAPPSPFQPGAFPVQTLYWHAQSQRKSFSFALLGERAETELAHGWDCDNGQAKQLGLLRDCWSECF